MDQSVISNTFSSHSLIAQFAFALLHLCNEQTQNLSNYEGNK